MAIQEAHALVPASWTMATECDIDVLSPLRAKAAHYLRLGRSDLADGTSVRGARRRRVIPTHPQRAAHAPPDIPVRRAARCIFTNLKEYMLHA